MSSAPLLYRFSSLTREYEGTIVPPRNPQGDGYLYPANATAVAPEIDPDSLGEHEILIFSPVEGWMVQEKEVVKEKLFTQLSQEKETELYMDLIHEGYRYKLIATRLIIEYCMLAYMSRESTITIPVIDYTGSMVQIQMDRRHFEDLMDQFYRGYSYSYLERIKEACTHKEMIDDN